MNNEPDMDGTAQFAPQMDDTIQELLRKARGMLEHLRVNEAELGLIPASCVDGRRELWQPLVELLVRAREDPLLEDDARLEAQRVWAEELQISAIFIVTMCVHARTEKARKYFVKEPEMLDELIARMEKGRPYALSVLSTEDLDALRESGFLRPGE